MIKPSPTKIIFLIGIVILIILNLYTFIVAYPETYTPSPGITTSGSILAKDFSAYYVSAWRLWNNPGQIYHFGALGSAEPVIPPYPQAYKYLPSFLIIVSPLLTLDYQQALLAFDIIQFTFLPAIAYILYKLLESKNLAVTFAVMTIALLLPIPTVNWGMSPGYIGNGAKAKPKFSLRSYFLLAFTLRARTDLFCQELLLL